MSTSTANGPARRSLRWTSRCSAKRSSGRRRNQYRPCSRHGPSKNPHEGKLTPRCYACTARTDTHYFRRFWNFDKAPLFSLPKDMVDMILPQVFENLSVWVHHSQEDQYDSSLNSPYSYGRGNNPRDRLNFTMKFPFTASWDFQGLALKAFYPTATFRFTKSTVFKRFCEEHRTILPDIRRLEIERS